MSHAADLKSLCVQVLLDSEGIDAWDQVITRFLNDLSNCLLGAFCADLGSVLQQTGQYSTQIFSLAVLLSSLFVYNQMGGIDEAALDKLSLVTEMTKHIRVRSGKLCGSSQAYACTLTYHNSSQRCSILNIVSPCREQQ